MLDVRRGSTGQGSGAESQPRGLAVGKRALTGGLGAAAPAADAGWPAWTEAREQTGAAGNGSFLGVALDEAAPRAQLRGGELPLTREGVRRELEAMWAGGGRVRAQTWLLQLDVLSRGERGPEVEAALAMAREEIEVLSAEEKEFQARFERAGRAVTGEMLAGSEATVRGSLAGYGIELGPVLETAIEKEGRTAAEIGLDVLDNPLGPLGQAMVTSNPALHAGAESETASRAELAEAVRDLRTRAAELAEANAESNRLQVEVQRRRGGLCQTSHHGARADRPDFSHLAAFPAPELTFHGRRVPAADEPGLDVQAMGGARRVERLTAELRDAWRGHEARHPVLAAYRDRGGYPTEELGRLAGGRDEMHRELVRVSFERLCAIAKARQAVTSGAVSVLELPRVVKQTRARLGVEPGSIQDAFVGNAVADASDPDWLVWVVSALSFAGAILLAPATAGSSAALALDLGFFPLDVWFAIDAAADHTFAAAAALTDYDPDRALGDEELGAGDMIASLAGAALGAVAIIHGLTSGSRLGKAGRGGAGDELRAPASTGEPGARADQTAANEFRGAPESATPAAGASRPRVETPVVGLYDGISETGHVPDWTVRDRVSEEDGKKIIKSWITLPDGSSGHLERAYDPATGTLEMREAFLDDLPRWIDNGQTPLVPGKGIPTVTYFTLRQMKKMGIAYGSISKVKMSTIQNARAVIEYNVLLARGVPPAEAVLRTHSLRYGSTAIVQSGQSIVSASVGGDIWVSPLDDMLSHFERRAGRDAAELALHHDSLIAELGGGVITRDTPVSWNYDIELELAPIAREP